MLNRWSTEPSGSAGRERTKNRTHTQMKLVRAYCKQQKFSSYLSVALALQPAEGANPGFSNRGYATNRVGKKGREGWTCLRHSAHAISPRARLSSSSRFVSNVRAELTGDATVGDASDGFPANHRHTVSVSGFET